MKSHSTPSEEESEERYNELLKVLNLKNLAFDENAKQSILNICKQYSDIFHLPGDALTVNNFYKENLICKDEKPVYIKNYRLPHAQLQEIQSQVKDLIDKDIVENAVSPYNSPLFIVPKKGSENSPKFRLVVDYRQLNKKLVDDKFPLPRIEDILDKLGNATVFSTIDLTSSFHQIELKEESRPLPLFQRQTVNISLKGFLLVVRYQPIASSV